jgi:RimJ/RimL family protein N-acetyltransferase
VALAGSRITLRELTVEDAGAAWAWASDPDWFHYTPHDPVASVDEERDFMAARVIEAQTRPRVQYHLGIVQNDTFELIGTARLGVSAPAHRDGDIGYGVRRDLWGRGIATDAARLLLDFGFDTLGLHRISAVHHPDNVASGRVLQKLGMQFEGRLRDHMYAHGAWRDSLAYAILRDDHRHRDAD